MVAQQSQKKVLLITLSVVLAAFIGRLDANIVLISLPTISSFFKITASNASWIIIAFTLILTGTLMFFGSIIDRIGVKRIFIIGYVIFTLSSLLCGLSSTFSTLIIARIIQALGAAILLTASLAIVAKFIPTNKTGWTFGLMSAAQSVGVASGAGFGGVISGLFSWHWIFLVNVPIGLIAILIAFQAIPGDDLKQPAVNDGNKKAFDVVGTILSFFAIFLLVFGLSKGKDFGWFSLPTVLIFLGAIVLGVGFAVYEKSCKNPLLDLRIFNNKQFSYMTATFFMVYLIGGFCILLPFYFENVKNFKPQESGMVLMLYSILYMASGLVTGRIADKINPYVLCLLATALELIAAIVFSLTFYFPGYLYLAVFLMIFAIANGLFISPSNKIIMSFATSETKGMISGVLNLLIGISTVLGMSIYETIYSEFLLTSKFLAFRAVGIVSCVVFVTAFILCLMTWMDSCKRTS